MALVVDKTMKNNGQNKENIKVAIRVRPLLEHEKHREEVIYYP